ncbi:MAG: peptidase C1 [Acidobacteriota bacterium]
MRGIAIVLAAGLVASTGLAAKQPAKVKPAPARDHVVYQPKHEDPALKEIDEQREAAEAAAGEATDKVKAAQKEKGEAEKKERKTLRFDMSGIAKPASPEAFKPAFHFPPVRQYNTGTCWSFSTTSFYESEVYRLTGQQIRLSPLFTVYWEYVEKMRRFVRERGDSLVAEGSESNAVPRIWKQYGAVPLAAYPGVLAADGRHDHAHLIEQLGNLGEWMKAHDMWEEERAMGMVRAILDRELGPPPERITFEGATTTPPEFLTKVLRLNLDDYVEMISTLSLPFHTVGEYKVPDNWWRDASYHNVPLGEWYAGIKQAVAAGYTVAIGGDVSEPGINGFEDAAVIPSFDIPPEYIDQDSRELRFENHASEDDHGIHLVGMTATPDGHEWFLIKDSGSSSRWGKFEGYYFYRDDYIRLKMLTYTVHKSAIPEILAQFQEP